MEAGGADIIELGMPFSDPIADGHVIQETNTVSFKNIDCKSRIYLEIPIDCTAKRSWLYHYTWNAERGPQKGSEGSRHLNGC